tara:strand:- start:5 stop:361 length:357 start_codon:yes stop_codon:yes gene_type:complete
MDRQMRLLETYEIILLFEDGVHEGNIIGISDQIDRVFDFIRSELYEYNSIDQDVPCVFNCIVVVELFSIRIHGQQKGIKSKIKPHIIKSLKWLDKELIKTGYNPKTIHDYHNTLRKEI